MNKNIWISVGVLLLFGIQCCAVYTTNCTEGYFLSNLSNISKCLPCPAGTYQSETSRCTACPSNSTSSPASTSVKNCSCIAGYQKTSDGNCCKQPNGACVKGYFRITPANLSMCAEFFNVSCFPCPAGTYQIGNATTCTSCPWNSTSLPASTSVKNCSCNAGYAVSTGGNCSGCEAGTYKSAPGPSKCMSCPSNSSSGFASTSINNCSCIPGYAKILNGSCCKLSNGTCSRGYYRIRPANMSTCAPVLSNLSCAPCPAGTYQLDDSSTCTSCPLNSTSLPASTSINNCSCNAGYAVSTGGNCSGCEAGTYKSNPGSGKCLPCPQYSSSFLHGVDCFCRAGYRVGSLLPTPHSLGDNCDYPACSSSKIYTDFTGFFCLFDYQSNEQAWWIIAPSLPYSGIQLTFLEFQTEFQSDFVTVYFCVSLDCCGASSDPPPAQCTARKPVAKSGQVKSNTSAALLSPASCRRRPLQESSSNPILSASATAVLKVVFTSDFIVNLQGFAAKWESIEAPCVGCAAGTYKNTDGSAPCTACLAGQYSALSGATACHNCSGSSVATAGSATCTCIPGSTTKLYTPRPPYIPCGADGHTRPFDWYVASKGYICYIFETAYPNNQDLWWTIVSPYPQAAILLVFGDNETNSNWTYYTESLYDYVTVYECQDLACSPNATRKLMRHSGPFAPDPVWSLTGILQLKFSSDVSDGFSGFLAGWQIHPDLDNAAAELCKRCEAGYFKEVSGPTDCIRCPDGFYSDSPGVTLCTACNFAAHTFTSQNVTDRCSCNAGYRLVTYNMAEAECVMCPAGTFKSEVSDFDECAPCPPESNSTEGSYMCACRAGFYALPPDNDTDLSGSLTPAPIDPYVVYNQLPIPHFCPKQNASWENPLVLTEPSALVCRLDPLAREARRWIIIPNVPNAGVQLYFSNFFDLADNSDYVSVFACKDEACQCDDSGRCDSVLNPTSGSAQPDIVVASTGIMLVEYCTNCSASGNALLISSGTLDHSSPLYGSGFIAYYQSRVGDDCIPCKAGSYSGTPGPAACTLCPEDSYSNMSGSTACNMCPASYTSYYDQGSTLCRCAEGYTVTATYGNNSKSCSACPAGKYTGNTAECLPCAENANSREHADLCVCNAGYEWALPLTHSDPVPADSVCKFGCKTSACNGVQDRVLEYSSGLICHLHYQDNENVGWVIEPPEPNNGMILTFTTLQVEPGYDNVSIYGCQDTSCFHWNETYMQNLVLQNSTNVTIIFSIQESWIATETNTLPAPLITDKKVVKVFFHSDPSNTMLGFSLHWESMYGINCSACMQGLYKSVAGTSSCIPCPAGTYSSATNATTCLACPLNHYSNIVQSTTDENCRKCPGGSFSREGSTRVGDCSCYPGDYLDIETESCVSCPAGAYKQASGALPCSDCPQNSFSNAGSSDISDCLCNAGFHGNISESTSFCSPCPKDTFKILNGPSICIPCSVGSFSNFGSTSRSDCICSAGYESVAGNLSSQPPLNGECTHNSSLLDTISGTLCLMNYGINEHRWWIISPNQGGEYGISTVLLTFMSFNTELDLDHLDIFSCSDPGCLSPLLIASFSGNSLPDPIFSTVGTLKLVFTSDDSIELSGWSAFWQTEEIGCLPCSPGFFKSIEGPSVCVPCAEGSYTEDKTSAATLCLECSSGAWSSEMSSGSGSCFCDAGFYSLAQSICSLCPQGTFKTGRGNHNCDFCGVGTYGTEEGATSHMSCLLCGLNSFSIGPGSVSCQCNAGFFGISSSCNLCWEGKYTNVSGLSTCLDCSAGLYNAYRGSTTCLMCEEGTYSTKLGADVCQRCLQNSLSPAGSRNCSCNLGFYRSHDGICLSCQPGSYSGSYESTACDLCRKGEYSTSSESSACTLCSEGKYSPVIAAREESVCQNCSNNSHSTAGSVEMENCSCNAGYSVGNNSCEACSVGKYKSAAGSLNCTECSVLTSTDQIASVSSLDCIPCEMGMYWENTSCFICPAGKFSANVTIPCQQCSPGTFNNQTGQTACFMCNDGQFSPSKGAVSCMQCPLNSFSAKFQCICQFPYTGVILNESEKCLGYSVEWILAPAGESCYKICNSMNSSCLLPANLNSPDQLLMVANETHTTCDFITVSNSHLAPYR